MKVNLFITCICDVVKNNVSIATHKLLSTAGCEIVFLENQTCCMQPNLNNGYINKSLKNIKRNIEMFEVNNFPIVCPASSCVFTIKQYHEYLDEENWKERAKRIADRTFELTDFIVNVIKKIDFNTEINGTAVFHPSCSLIRKLKIIYEPITLLKKIKGLQLLEIKNQQTCCGFGGTFSVKMSDISSAMVTEKTNNIISVKPDFLIGVDSSCLLNISGRLLRENSDIKVMHIAEILTFQQN